VRVTQIQDLALKVDRLDWRPYYLWARIEARFQDKRIADRVATRGLMIDPGNAELHACRALAWINVDAVTDGEMATARTLARPHTAADLSPVGWKIPLDPVAAYFVALHRVRMDPQHLGARADMLRALDRLDHHIVNGEEVMPDAREQHQREAGVAALMARRLRARPEEEWAARLDKGTPATREHLDGMEAAFLVRRGTDCQRLGRPEAARDCLSRALQLDPRNPAALESIR
jgi:hypothetical protein